MPVLLFPKATDACHEAVRKSSRLPPSLLRACAVASLTFGVAMAQASDVRITSDTWSGSTTTRVEDDDRGPAAAETSIDSPNLVTASFSWATGLGRAHAITSSNGAAGDRDIARASIYAEDTFTVIGDIEGTVTGVVHFEVHGSVDVFAHGGPFNGQAYVSGSLFVYDMTSGPLVARTDFGTGTVLVQPGGSAKSASLNETYALPFEISTTHRNFSLDYRLQVYSEGHAEVDFSNTSAITLELPAGLTFSSDSGVLLTEVPQPVPEPRTWALVMAGVLLLIGRSVSRRSHRR